MLFEYNRAQQKEVAKKKKEEMAQQTALAVAAAEREVRSGARTRARAGRQQSSEVPVAMIAA